MVRLRSKEALIGGGVSLASVVLAIIVVLPQASHGTPASATTPLGSFSPQVLGTEFTVPSASPDPAESSQLALPAPVETTFLTSTVTALSTVLVSGKPVVQTAFRTTTATARVTLPPKAGPTVRVTRTFLATITQAGKVSVVTQTATAIQIQTQTQTQTQTATVTDIRTKTPAPVTVTATVTTPGPTQTVTATVTTPGPTQTVTQTATCTADPLTLAC